MSNWSCIRCSLQFDKNYAFDLHLSLVHGEKIEVKNETIICKENVQDPQMSKGRLSNDIVEKQFKCDICDSFFQTKQTLKRHIQSIHTKEKPYLCNICDTKV